jgi:parallel beta-helix repeat protein/putative cofactor-binding repeat protein
MFGHASHGSVAKTKRTLGGVAALLAVFAGCSGSPSPPAARTATARPDVQFLGPSRLTERGALRARASAPRGRVVAVTFYLDGRPLGSDTTAPYELDVDPGFIPAGRHRLRVDAVDSLGQRRTTKPSVLTTTASGSGVISASPSRGFARAAAALRRGGVTVRLAPGRYEVTRLRLGSGARLVGSGPRTVIAARRGAGYWALIVAKGNEIRISDLTIDGGGSAPASPEGGIALAVFDGSRDVRLQRLQLARVRTYGVSVWGAHSEVSVQDSQIESNGGAQAGVFSLGSDRSRDTSVIRTRIRGFRSFGILLGQKEYGRPRAALHGVALDNVIEDIRDPARDACRYAPRAAPGCGTNEGGIWSGGVEAAIIGNTIRNARWDGIETVGSSTRTTIVRNEIRETRTGIYIERSTNDSLISRNLISGAPTGINVEWRHGGGGSSRNIFSQNRIVGAEAGLFVDVGGDGNTITGNVFVGGRRPAITLQGSSGNLVRGNVGCRSDGELIALQSARSDDGSPAGSHGNRLVANRSVRSC